MSEAMHTPGPWKQHPEYPWIIKQDNAPISEAGLTICNTTSYPDSGFFPSPSEGRANARLIAAAPELLAALESLEREGWFKHIVTACQKETADNNLYKAVTDARAAIAKATEEST